MPQVLHVGVWELKDDFDIKPLAEELQSWSLECRVPGLVTAVFDKFHNFPLPKEAIEAFGMPSGSNFLERGYTHCFYSIFEDMESRVAYDHHPLHLKVSEMLGDAFVNGIDSVLSFDMLLPGSFK